MLKIISVKSNYETLNIDQMGLMSEPIIYKKEIIILAEEEKLKYKISLLYNLEEHRKLIDKIISSSYNEDLEPNVFIKDDSPEYYILKNNIRSINWDYDDIKQNNEDTIKISKEFIQEKLERKITI